MGRCCEEEGRCIFSFLGWGYDCAWGWGYGYGYNGGLGK
jgi:hypothetical protein